MADKHELTIATRDLDAAGKPYRFVLRPAWLREVLAETHVTPDGAEAALDVRASKSGRDVLVRGRIKAQLVVPCGRCLEPAQVTVDEEVSALFVPSAQVKGSKGPDDEFELSADDADTVPFDGETVVLDDVARDELLLAVPMIPLCSEACPGISRPADPGEAQPAIDPRLSPLLRYKAYKAKT
jgi:uncharacterized protein